MHYDLGYIDLEQRTLLELTLSDRTHGGLGSGSDVLAG